MPKFNDIDTKNWREYTDILTNSFWSFHRENSGIHNAKYHGNFIPQIPNQLIRRYTKTNDTVLELFSGSGTTLFECEKLQRDYIGFDINTNICDYVKQQMTDCKAIKFAINNIDVTDSTKMSYTIDEWMIKNDKKGVDFMIAHPPYLDIVKFTDDSRDLSNISNIDCFLNKLTSAIANGFKYLKTNCYFAIIAGDIYRNSEVIPLAFRIMDSVKQNFNVKILTKLIE